MNMVTENPINQEIVDVYLKKLKIMESQIAKNIKLAFSPDSKSSESPTLQFFNWLESDFNYLHDPILFQFSRSALFSIYFKSSVDLVSFNAFEFPSVIQNLDPKRKLPIIGSRNIVSKLASSRLIIPNLVQKVGDKHIKSAIVVRGSMHQNSRQYLISLFREPEYEEILKALWFDRKIWWRDLTIWPHNTCKRCGQNLGHPVSKVIGIGPECGGHKYETDEEFIDGFREVVFNFKKSRFFQVPPEQNPIILVRMDEILSKMNRSR
jgi:hypothetical protein